MENKTTKNEMEEYGIVQWFSPKRGFGFISSEKGERVFVHFSEIIQEGYKKLEEGNLVMYEITANNKGPIAKKVRKVNHSHNENELFQSDNTYPGLRKGIRLEHFTQQEKNIIDNLKQEFYITNGGGEIKLAKSKYRYFLMKPANQYQEMFNLNREFVVVFSPYHEFEPRTIDAVDSIIQRYQSLRLDKVCSVIISMDKDIKEKIKEFLKDEASEMQSVIPFSYQELLNIKDKYLIVNRFRKYFYERDLFAFQDPLKKDLYFFGRKDIVHALVDKHFSGENSAIFGLRKTGKTSILYGIQRVLEKRDAVSVWIDCQIMHFKKWNSALFYIVHELANNNRITFNRSADEYTTDRAAELFKYDIKYCYNQLNNKTILLLFDEIENITFDISISEQWRSGIDFVKFWQVIRSSFQASNNVFTYIIAGTNPISFEKVNIKGVDNPIYGQVDTNNYIQPFTFNLTKEMVNKLGGYMGLQFDDYVCAALNQDYGGHPFLIRHVCSAINKFINNDSNFTKPIVINKMIYDKAKVEFETHDGNKYAQMILQVLRDYYPDEFKVLEKLAIGDYNNFIEHVTKSPDLTSHLIGYGIIQKTGNLFGFRIESLKNFLAEKNKYKKVYLTNEQKQSEINTRRNQIEPKLRTIVSNQLKFILGINKAKQIILSSYSKNKRKRYEQLEYKELFDPNKCEIYFTNLIVIMKKKWEECFRIIFETDEQKFTVRMEIINEMRKGDCHASEISNADMESFRGAMTWLENKSENYFGGFK